MDDFAQGLDEATGGAISQVQQRQEEAQRQEQEQTRRREPDTVGEAFAPVLDAEKTDIQFWMSVVQTVALILILRELRRR